PNDIVFDQHGGFWFTDLGKVRARDQDRGAVYYARADGSLLVEVIQPMVHPNGIGLSPDGDTLYVAESLTGRLWAFEITGPGEIRRQPWPSPNGGRLGAAGSRTRALKRRPATEGSGRMGSIRIGTGSAWWGDRIEPAKLNAEQGDLDYLCFETMAEATISAAQVRKRRDPSFPGYDTYLDDRMQAV